MNVCSERFAVIYWEVTLSTNTNLCFSLNKLRSVSYLISLLWQRQKKSKIPHLTVETKNICLHKNNSNECWKTSSLRHLKVPIYKMNVCSERFAVIYWEVTLSTNTNLCFSLNKLRSVSYLISLLWQRQKKSKIPHLTVETKNICLHKNNSNEFWKTSKVGRVQSYAITIYYLRWLSCTFPLKVFLTSFWLKLN